ncbi:MAG: hypothetical protein NTW21_26560 [Verrucomicrobia bacterium]|nr:hypothetical protein [Verrucomicrobiota bacterium]
MKRLLNATTALETGAGLFLLAAPATFAGLLFGVPLETAAALTVARIGGAGLLALGIAAWFAASDAGSFAARGLVGAMILYNLGAAVLLGTATWQPASNALVLWLGVVLHTAMAVWCMAQLLKPTPPAKPR